jgi:dephospho-CoA kinase
MIRAQASREARLAIADDVIVNNSDIRTLASQVQSLHERYLAAAGALAGN